MAVSTVHGTVTIASGATVDILAAVSFTNGANGATVSIKGLPNDGSLVHVTNSNGTGVSFPIVPNSPIVQKDTSIYIKNTGANSVILTVRAVPN